MEQEGGDYTAGWDEHCFTEEGNVGTVGTEKLSGLNERDEEEEI